VQALIADLLKLVSPLAPEVLEIFRPFKSKFWKVQYFSRRSTLSLRVAAIFRDFTQIWTVLVDFSTLYKTSMKLLSFIQMGDRPKPDSTQVTPL
jgi:hypothetical protein